VFVFLAFAPLGHGIAGLLEDTIMSAIARELDDAGTGAAGLSVQRGTALLTPQECALRERIFDITALPKSAANSI